MKRIRVALLLGGALFAPTVVASAEDQIQTFINPNGRIVFTNTNFQNSPQATIPSNPAASSIETPDWLQSLVERISTAHGVDPALVRAVIKTESNFNRWAVSSKGALGLMQLIPSTGRRYGVRDFFDPQQNIDGGVRYLKFLLQKFKGNLDLSLAAYNAGENLVERLGRIPPIAETVNYVHKVRAIYPGPALVAASTAAEANPAPAPIFKTVDDRGIVHFSNIEPSN